jgi:hypothetical protein
MSDLLTDLIPLNLLQEKEKFFADPTYNPQFKYIRQFEPRELIQWGVPIEELFIHSTEMLAKYPTPISSGEPINREYIENVIHEFNQKYKLEHPLQTHFSENQVSRCRISNSDIYFQLPIRFTAEKFADLCRHELETHAFRRLNHEKNFPGRPIEEENFRRTEEGLAGLHSFLFRENKIIHRSYRSYYAIYLAQNSSFAEVFAKLLELRISPQLAWSITVRCKRGFEDTSLPGAFTKDICYLEGAVKIWQWLQTHSQEIEKLYIGRLNLAEIDLLADEVDLSQILLPTFFADRDNYLYNMNKIATVNEFEKMKDYITHV